MKKWICPVCGYVYEGENPPAECPICHCPGSKFLEQSDDLVLASEHEFGVYGSQVKNNPNIPDEDKAYILEQLKANFAGECAEVGMYLCMARVANREGYPEIGSYWTEAAYDEAGHAARYAELLGDECDPNMSSSSEKNLAWRVQAELGATKGKTDLAEMGNKYGIDAIDDIAHETARDEARHCRAFNGLLKRYFG